MAIVKLTKRNVDAAKKKAHRYDLLDTDLKGFALRVYPTGEKSWCILYRPGDGGRRVPLKRHTIGNVGTLTPEEARAAATVLLATVKLGADPATARANRRAVVTMAELAATFLSDHVDVKRRASTAALYSDILNRLVLPELGGEKADTVKRADLTRLHGELAQTPFQANRMLAVVGSMFTFGGKVGLLPESFNPARGIERYPEEGRERYLTTEELERIGVAIREAETIGIPWQTDESKPGAKHLPKDLEKRRTVIGEETAAALRLLILTGARLREILHLRWEEVDLERGLLFLPTSKSGRKTIVLNAPALAVLDSLKRMSTFVIPGDARILPDGTTEDRPRSDLKRPWAVVSKRAGLDGVRLHDLRHTFASYAASGGLGLPVIGKLLGHTNASTTQRYAHVAADPLRRASDATASTIAAHMGEPLPEATVGQPSADIIPLKRGG